MTLNQCENPVMTLFEHVHLAFLRFLWPGTDAARARDIRQALELARRLEPGLQTYGDELSLRALERLLEKRDGRQP